MIDHDLCTAVEIMLPADYRSELEGGLAGDRVIAAIRVGAPSPDYLFAAVLAALTADGRSCQMPAPHVRALLRRVQKTLEQQAGTEA